MSNNITTSNEQFGNIEWNDGDKILEVIEEELPRKVAADRAYQNAIRNSDKQNARVEHDKALHRVILEILGDHIELFKQFSDNPSFKRWLADSVFDLTYRPAIPEVAGLGREWLNRAQSFIEKIFGPNQKWRDITETLWRHFQLQTDAPILLPDIEQMSGELRVAIDDVITVIQVLANAEPSLLVTTFRRVEAESGEEREVALGEVRQILSNLSARGTLGARARDMANQTVLGWKPMMEVQHGEGA